MQYPSKLVERAVEEMSKLPGIGKKTALRLVLHMLKEEKNFTFTLSEALEDLVEKIKYCKKCRNISDDDLCMICSSHRRDATTICVVEGHNDVLAIENTSQYNGLYHVLGGLISPIAGVGPEDLNFDLLIKRINQEKIKEIILALSTTMDGDTTAFYLSKRLGKMDVKVTSIARGIPIGGELEFTDEITLGRSIMTRITYTQSTDNQ